MCLPPLSMTALSPGYDLIDPCASDGTHLVSLLAPYQPLWRPCSQTVARAAKIPRLFFVFLLPPGRKGHLGRFSKSVCSVKTILHAVVQRKRAESDGETRKEERQFESSEISTSSSPLSPLVCIPTNTAMFLVSNGTIRCCAPLPRPWRLFLARKMVYGGRGGSMRRERKRRACQQASQRHSLRLFSLLSASPPRTILGIDAPEGLVEEEAKKRNFPAELGKQDRCQDDASMRSMRGTDFCLQEEHAKELFATMAGLREQARTRLWT